MASSNSGSSGNAVITVRPDPPSSELIEIINNSHYAERKKAHYLMILTKLSQQAGSHGIPYGIIKQLTTTMGKLGKADQLPNLISILEEYRSRVGMAPLALGGSRKRRSTRRRRSKATKKRRSQ